MIFRISNFEFRICQPPPPGLGDDLGSGLRRNIFNANGKRFETGRSDLRTEPATLSIKRNPRTHDSVPDNSFFEHGLSSVGKKMDFSGFDGGMNPVRNGRVGEKFEIRNSKFEIGSVRCD